MMEDKRSYEELLVKENVMVKVPREGPYMTFVKAHEFEPHGKMVPVEAHWRNGMSLGRIILNRLFYGIEEKDLGKKIVATVQVIQKTTVDGRKYLMLDIIKAPAGTRTTSNLMFPTNGSGDISIPGTSTKILFKQR